MRLIFVSLMAASLMAGCKTRKHSSKLSEEYGPDALDALILSDDLVQAPQNCRYQLMNLTLDALNEGLLRNGALTGLGTDNPVGKKLKADSLYYQGVRIASIFDWEFTKRVLAGEPGCLPSALGLQLGTFPRTYNSALAHPFPDDVKKLKAAALHVNKSLGLFDVLSLPFREKLMAWPQGSALPPEHQAALLSGVRTKLRFAQEASSQNGDELRKLKGILSSSSPLAITYQAQFQKAQSRTYLEAYLPPLFEIEDSNLDDLGRWHLVRGLKKHKLTRPIQISVATLTHIGYLPEQDPESQPLIKMQMFKDFAQPDVLKTRIIFGRLKEDGAEKGVIPMDYKDYRDSFTISFYPNVAIKDDDNATVKSLKTQFNDIAGQIKVDARIHQLTLNLTRKPLPDPSNANDLMLSPKFSLKDSDISFRLHRFTADEAEQKNLSNVGFLCQAQPTAPEKDCFQDFGAYSDLRDFVLKGDQGVANGRLTTKIGNAFKGLLNSVTRYNVKFIVDWNLPEIEAAIDQEFAAILEDLIDDQMKTKDKIRERLEQKLFEQL